MRLDVPALLANLRGDILGGLVSASVAIPLCIGFGMFAFVSLGDEYLDQGALAALLTSCVVGVVCIVLGDRSANLYAPRIISTFFIGSLLYQLLHSDAAPSVASRLPTALAVLFAIMLLAGVFELLFGLVRLGTLIKFVPHPVMAGFQNAAALLLFLVQLGNVMGFERSTPFRAALAQAGEAKPLSLVVAAIAFASTWYAKQLLPRIPPLVVGLAAGAGVYWLIVAAGFAGGLGPPIGNMNASLLGFAVLLDFNVLAHDVDVLTLLPTILSGALALALIASIDALLCAKLLSRPGEAKVDGDRLLTRLGAGNILAASLGGITSGLNLGPSLLNKATGGRTPVSVLVNIAALVLATAMLFPVLAYLPRAVLSGVIMVIAIQHFDPWTVRMTRRFVAGTALYRRKVAVDLLVVLVVATISILASIVVAVFIGIAIAVLLFILRMSRSVVRRMYRCDQVRSRTARTVIEMEALQAISSRIVVLELQGALFFGTAETLGNEIEQQLAIETRSVILDFRRVTEVDSTGAQILQELNAGLHARDKQLLLVVTQPSGIAEVLADFGTLEAIGEKKTFKDIDRAIEWAENDLLRDRKAEPAENELRLEELGVLRGFNADELDVLRPFLLRTTFRRRWVVFREGEAGKELFIIAKGTASAFLEADHARTVRLTTFTTGTVFGELAILDPGLRSATVVSEAELVCYVLPEDGFQRLSNEAPGIAIKLLANLGRVLSTRLRQATRTINQLEQ